MIEYKTQVSPDEIRIAKDADLLELIRRCGHRVVKLSGSEYCLEAHDSFRISHNFWCWHSQGQRGGDAIEFIRSFPKENQCSFQEAVQRVNEIMGHRSYDAPPAESNSTFASVKPTGDFTLPPVNENSHRVTAYLTKTRGLDNSIVMEQIRDGRLYESAGRHNCVFVGKDADGKARYGTERGTLSDKRYVHDIEGSSKDYGFVMPGHSDKLYVFESPVDALSHASITKAAGEDYKEVSRLSLGGLSDKALIRYLQDHPEIKSVALCLDNDIVGRAATERITQKLAHRITVENQPSKSKDYNDDLLHIRAQTLTKGRVK